MNYVARSILAALAVTLLMPFGHATAQNGRLIEGLFRTLAEQQIEKERLKRAAAKKRPPALQPPGYSGLKPSKDPYEVRLPSGFGPVLNPNLKPLPNKQPRVTLTPGKTSGAINVRSREAAAYVKNLVALNTSLDQLIPQLRTVAAKRVEIRPLLPQVYKVKNDGRALLRRCDGISSLSPIIQGYRQLDANWRQVSFSLQSLGAFDNSCTTLIKQCDSYCSSMCEQLQIQPQFDHRALHENLIVAGAYMAALLDDLEIASLPPQDSRKLMHDCRILRQRLLTSADHVHEMTYQEASGAFTSFLNDWGKYAQRVYECGDPHLDRRLSRISEVGDQTYSILWMAPPATTHDLIAVSRRLDTNVAALQSQITLRAIAGLPAQEQLRVLNTTSALYKNAVTLQKAAQANAPHNQLHDIFQAIERDWRSVQEQYFTIPKVNRGVLAEIRHALDEIRLALGHGQGGPAVVTAQQLLQSAAALEGTAEYINKIVRDSSRSLTPSSYRSSVTNAAREFYTHARELHEEISRPGRINDPRHLKDIQRETTRMVEGWNQLTKDLNHVEEHGMSPQRASQIRRAQNDVVPFVAQVAAAFLGE